MRKVLFIQIKFCSIWQAWVQLGPLPGLHQLSGPCQGRDHTPAFWYILVDVDRHRSSVLFGANLPSGTDLHAEIDMKRTWNTHPVLIISHLKWDKVAMKVSRFKPWEMPVRTLEASLQPVAVTQNTMKNCKFNQILSNFGVLVVKGSQRWCKVWKMAPTALLDCWRLPAPALLTLVAGQWASLYKSLSLKVNQTYKPGQLLPFSDPELAFPICPHR